MLDPRPLRVLVVDDYLDGAEALAQLLAYHGHDARSANTRAEALALVSDGAGFAPDVVMLDLRLPDGDGFSLAVELCGVLPAKPVLIAHTGYPGMEEKCRAAGFDHYLLKPTDPVALATLLTTCPKL